MGGRRFCSPWIAISLICGIALVSLYRLQHRAWELCALSNSSDPVRFVAKYESLRSVLPADEMSHFVVDAPHADPTVMDFGARSYLAQYAISPLVTTEWPRLVAGQAEPRWIVVESDHPEAAPEIAARPDWALVADLRNGLRVYRRDLGK
jgi:hypothetical protein